MNYSEAITIAFGQASTPALSGFSEGFKRAMDYAEYPTRHEFTVGDFRFQTEHRRITVVSQKNLSGFVQSLIDKRFIDAGYTLELNQDCAWVGVRL